MARVHDMKTHERHGWRPVRLKHLKTCESVWAYIPAESTIIKGSVLYWRGARWRVEGKLDRQPMNFILPVDWVADKPRLKPLPKFCGRF